MGLWGFYFLAKLYLYFKGYLRLHIVLNLLFALFLTVPIPEKYRYRALTALKAILSLAIGFVLLWYDSWLSSPFDAMNFLQSQGMPSKEYIISFVLGAVSPREAMIIGVIFILSLVINKYLKLTPIVVILLLAAIPLSGTSKAEVKNAAQTLDEFFDYESQRVVRFKGAPSPDFDIVILHVCSLSSDDLKETGLENDPFFSQFDYLFTNFNTATSYSGPAVIRLLRSPCGQPRHDDLYTETSKDCFLFDALASRGFEANLAFNHDGIYGNFAEDVKRFGHLHAPPLRMNDLNLSLYMFDNSPVYDDYQVLEKWWRTREHSKPGAALYYNTVTLHDGAHWAGEKKWFQRDRKEQYVERLHKLLENMNRFFNLLASSGRKVVVVFVPEHGMALKGTNMQVMGLRDIPLPQITKVPVGIKVLGGGLNGAKAGQKIISKPTSYLAITHMLSSFMEKSPFVNDNYSSRAFIENIPQTDLVSENLGMLIMKDGPKYYLHGKEKNWIEIMESDLN
ncbi:MAG: cellulose biosynthesis protein BcsG [Deltaproteobacteria bacterium]|nr:cellulose biosynthesis protein BcsG [Deltaproteobacteria bacterium]